MAAFQKLALAWIVLVALAVGAAWMMTRPRYDAVATGTVVDIKEVNDTSQGGNTFAYVHTVAFATPQKDMRVTFTARTSIREPRTISYNSANPDQYEICDASAFAHDCQLIGVAALVLAALGALLLRLVRANASAPA